MGDLRRRAKHPNKSQEEKICRSIDDRTQCRPMPLLSPDPLTDDALAAFAHRYGVPATAIRQVPGGVANRAFLLGDDLFLRIPREPAFVHDLRKEAEVIPWRVPPECGRRRSWTLMTPAP